MNRKINGVLPLDKPLGLSSNEALQAVKKLFRAAKAGHAGSLDPKASGMLLICFGEATKFSQFLLEANKRYLVTGKLGEISASGDGETEIISRREIGNVDKKRIEEVLVRFRGRISQLPTMYSALKHQGVPLYKLARQGLEVPREPREVEIFNLDLLKFEDDYFFLDVVCSKGTYIRTLVVDIEEALGCGARVAELRRLVVGGYTEDQMISMVQLEELVADGKDLGSLLLPLESMVSDLPEIILTPDMLYYARRGNVLWVTNAPLSGMVRLKEKNGQFCGVGTVLNDGKISPKKIIYS